MRALSYAAALALGCVNGPVTATQIYWTQDNHVRRIAPGESSVETLVTVSNSWPRGIALDPVHRKLYWVNAWGSAVSLQRANLDGSGLENLVFAAVAPGLGWGRPETVAIDSDGAASGGVPKLYLGETDTERILRANLDGTGLETVVSGLPNDTYVKGVAVDSSHGKVYWAGCCPDQGPPAIGRANLDGSGFELIALEVDPGGVALDLLEGKVYWGSRDTAAIWRANLDGSQRESVLNGVGDISCLALDRSGGVLYWADPTNLWSAPLPGGGGARQLLAAGTNWIHGIAVDTGAPLHSVELVPFTATWKYEQNGTDLGLAWRAPGYDDSNWPSGQAALGEDFNPAVNTWIRTPLVLETNGSRTVTFYFRTKFHVPALHPEYLLRLEHLVDDGAVFYLNGVEVQRFNMPPVPVDWQTRANFAIPTHLEGKILGTNGSSAPLVPGENVLAVEVHQANLDSTDIVFGAALHYVPHTLLHFSKQPLSTSEDEGRPVTLSGSVLGTPPSYQWFKDGVPIPGATQDRFSIPSLNVSDAGHYYLVATNPVHAVTSQVATVTVKLFDAPVLEPPLLLGVTPAPDSLEGWIVEFDHELDMTTALDPNHYAVRRLDTGALVPITGLQQYGGSLVRLTTPALAPGINHVLTVNGVRDLNGLEIPPNSRAAFPVSLPLFGFSASWRYNDTGSDLGTAWRESTFDDSGWPAGAGLLYNDQNFNPPQGLAGATVINATNTAGLGIVTHYFRRHFNLASAAANPRLRLRQAVDDGAVYYLNGLEIARFNMAAGAVNAGTRANSSSQEGVIVSQTANAPGIVAGDNVLAVEVHQFSLSSPNFPDVTFGLEATLEADSLANVEPVVLRQPRSLTVREHESAVFSAEILAATGLQWLRDGQPIPGATESTLTLALVSGAEDGTQFRLRGTNTEGSATSDAAVLRVILDQDPPQVLGANFGTNATLVTVTFSETLDFGTASDRLNYVLRDDLGEVLAIQDAMVLNGSNVVLATAPRIIGRHLTLFVSGVADASVSRNMVQDAVPVGYEVVRFHYSGVWRYNDTGLDPGTQWREPGYADETWPSGAGLLGFEDFDTPLAEPIRTMLPPPEFRGPVYYFRTILPFTPHPQASAMWLRYFVDDGAVFYLNGVEVHRVRVPANQDYRTLASGNVEAVVEGPVPLSEEAFLPDVNVFAAEVHQSSLVSADSVFGVQISDAFDVQPVRQIRPKISLQSSGGKLILSWDGAGDFVLEGAPTPLGPWERVATPTNPYTVPTTNSARFFRLSR